MYDVRLIDQVTGTTTLIVEWPQFRPVIDTLFSITYVPEEFEALPIECLESMDTDDDNDIDLRDHARFQNCMTGPR